MEKGFGFLVTLITCASVGLVVVACSDENETSTFGGDGVDASTDSPPVFGGSSSGGEGGTSSSGGEGGTPGAKCEPVIPSNYSPSWVAPTEPASPGPCNATTVGSYYDECLATLGNPDHQTRCDAWKTANTTCGQCIEPTNNGGPIQWHRSRFYYTANIAGCIAIGQDKYSNADCGYAYGAHVNCKRDACAGCWETNSSSFDDFQKCQGFAGTVGACGTLNTQVGTLCTGYKDAPETKGCLKDAAEDAKTYLTRLMTTFCAKP